MRLPVLLAALLTVAPLAGAAALEKPPLDVGRYWTYRLVDADGTPLGDDATANVTVGSPGPNGTVPVETRTTFTREVRGGSFEVDSRTTLEVDPGDLGVRARETVTVRDGSFNGTPIWSYTRNRTTYEESLPLVPAPADPGDVWRTQTVARSEANQTDRVGEGEDADTVESRTATYRHNVTETLTALREENASSPAGTFPSLLVNRTRTTEDGYTLEWWSDEPGYMVRWETYTAGHNRTGGASLVDWGRVLPPGEGFPWLAAVGAALGLAGGAALVAWRTGRL